MKIKKIEFCNINSLAGEWIIDFESPDFAKSGMFCISGPTGSGKTSILDAICIGLYGKTPRLKAIVGESNEAMTYGTKRCYAKISFECNGTVYSARWEQHRAARTNKLQKYSWVLINETAGSTEASFSNQTEIEKTMTRVIGLDFDQFTKSMMLAQGKFNKFLKCSENERAAILEKLTGDVIYRKIAIAVHDLYLNAKRAAEDVENKMKGITLLSLEELAKLNENIAEATSQKEKLNEDVERFLYICTWFENLHGLESHLQTAKVKLDDAQREKDKFEPNREKLERALRAQEVETSFTEFDSIRGNLDRMRSQFDDCKSKLPEAESNLEKSSKDNAEKQASLEKIKADYSANETLWEEVSSLDVNIKNAQTQLKNTELEVSKIVTEIGSTQKKIDDADKCISDNEQALQKVETYIAENQKDETIDGLISLLKSQVAEWKTENGNVLAGSEKLEKLKSSLQKFDDACERQKQELQVLQEYLESHKADAELVNILPEVNGFASDAERHHKEVFRLQDEIDAKKTQMGKVDSDAEKANSQLASLQSEKETIIQEDIPVVVAELRHHLKPGEPCPVCGSKEHLSCEQAEAVESGAERLNDFADKLRKINGEMENAQRSLDSLTAQRQNIESVLGEYVQKQNDESAAEKTALENLNAKLAPWESSVTLDSSRAVLQKLQELKTTYLQKKDNADALQNEVRNAAVNRANLAGDVNVAEETLKKSQTDAQALSQKIEEAFATWFSNVRMDDADALLAELEKKNSWWKKSQEKKLEVEKKLDTERLAKEQFKESLVQTQSRLDESKRKCDEMREGLSSLESKRKELFGEKSVEGERKQARLKRDSAERMADDARRKEQQMREAKVALDNSIADLNGRIAEAEPKFAQSQSLFFENLAAKNFADEQEFKAAKLPEAERKSLQQLQKSVDDALTSAQAAIKSCSEQLADHQKKRNFEESEESAKQNRDSSKSKLNECTVHLATWIEQRSSDEKFRKQHNDMQAELAVLTEKRTCWEQMQHWFNGSRLETGNGDTFVKFIQTITLRNLLKIANGYLHDMFPRYEMVAKEGTLDIHLVDHDNSDAVRPIDNISGGEGFLVSLSLALGISTLASRNVSIDSMFLDEGFGTLDSKMLQETVIVLQKMQQEKGKLLGVITHVDLVKSELPTHIDVTPRGGRSVLSGAGVRNGISPF